jgi:hypothetical protein
MKRIAKAKLKELIQQIRMEYDSDTPQQNAEATDHAYHQGKEHALDEIEQRILAEIDNL